MTELQPVDPGPPGCELCGAEAVGPCARCHAMVCGDCCVLTEGSAKTWAICTRCDGRGGRSLARGWLAVVLWIAMPIVALAVALALLQWLFG